MSTIRLRWRGPGRKVVPLPCPLLSLSEQTGEVVCDPIGEFPKDAAQHLLSLGDAFELVDPPPASAAPVDPDEWDDEGPLAARPPTDRPVIAFRAKGIAAMHAKNRGLELRENPGSEKPWELWVPSPATPEGTDAAAVPA